ncbi:hypothetical protein KIW84_031308 [Lathyrus oleraceus]|uniref:ABC transmembrane type-1 domain-containing protein n=1 Tax=Pisum sativum TaxID=3888 RepID=A0A9D5AXA5_PEA|nr:hypothetical protein KIW84_031308 [Pisum sativum]
MTDKILDLARDYPALMSLRSYDLLPSSWMSVAWYPIYRIPTGPTLKDLDAYFLTYHTLHTPLTVVGSVTMPGLTLVYPSEMDGIPNISIPTFAMAAYKLKGSISMKKEAGGNQVMHSLLQAADEWLRLVQIIHVLRMDDQPAGSQERFERFTKLALTIVYIAARVFAVGWIEVSCWILTGERQTAVIRSNYVQVLLNQDMSFFDTYGNNGDIVSQVLSDVLLIQSALSEKVGNYIHNMATFFSGLVIGLTNCWQIALITLATGPFIVAAGGISNIFLHRPARISRLENEQELNLVQIKESKWLVKCLLNYLRHDKNEVNVLFDILTIFLFHSRIDYTFLKEFYIIEIAEGYSSSMKKALLLHFLNL